MGVIYFGNCHKNCCMFVNKEKNQTRKWTVGEKGKTESGVFELIDWAFLSVIN